MFVVLINYNEYVKYQNIESEYSNSVFALNRAKKCACRLSHTPVRRQDTLAPSRDRISLSFPAK